jgi:SRSO17 transposase
MAKITEKLGLKISVKSFAESLREFSKEANRAKGDVLQRIGFFIDRRRNVYVIIDDTPDIRYGKKVFAAAYQHNNTFNTRLWQDTIVDCAVFHNGAYINNYFEVYVPKGYIERTTGKKGEEIEIRTKIEIAITIVKEAVAWLLNLGFSKKRIHILSDSWYDSRSFIGTIKELGVNSVQFIKRDFYVRVKGKAVRIDIYFEKHKEERYFKNAEGKKVFYKETRLYVPDVGYLKFLRSIFD